MNEKMPEWQNRLWTFCARFVAAFMDSIIFYMLLGILLFLGFLIAKPFLEEGNILGVNLEGLVIFFMLAGPQFACLAIFAATESVTSYQSSPAKRLLRLMVVDQNGNRVSFKRALLRNMIKFFPATAVIVAVGIFALGIYFGSFNITTLMDIMVTILSPYAILGAVGLLIPCIFTRHGQGIHDLISGTMVVRR